MSALDIAHRHRRERQRIAAGLIREGHRLWQQVDLDALDVSWERQLARLLVLLAGAQLLAASMADEYVDAALAAQGLDSSPAGQVVPGAFAGVASDGRTLEGLLWSPLVSTAVALSRGMPRQRALAAGQATLDMVLATQVADAGRVADGVAITARPDIGYIRVLTPPSCSRCIVLVDRIYRWNAGFQRHPRCDCVHLPANRASAEQMRLTARSYFDSLSREEQDRIFTKAGAQAIRDGANIAQVVNARRGMRKAQVFGHDVLITTEGTTVRGLAGQQLIRAGARTRRELAEFVTRQTRTGPQLRQVRRERVQIPRLMPESIYAEATSREDAIRLLRRFGYIR